MSELAPLDPTGDEGADDQAIPPGGGAVPADPAPEEALSAKALLRQAREAIAGLAAAGAWSALLELLGLVEALLRDQEGGEA